MHVVAHVVLALVPYRTGYGHDTQRVNHGVVFERGFLEMFRAGVARQYGVAVEVAFLVHVECAFKASHGLCSLEAYPRLAGRAAPGAVHEPYGHVELLVELAAEEVGQRREVGHRGGGAYLPPAVVDGRVFLRRERQCVRHLQQAYERVGGIGHFLLVVEHAAPALHGHFHVRLPAAQPYLAGIEVVEQGGLAVVEAYPERASACVGNFEAEGELSFVVGLKFNFFALQAEGYGYVCSRRCFAGNGYHCVVLQHHSACEESGQCYLC